MTALSTPTPSRRERRLYLHQAVKLETNRAARRLTQFGSVSHKIEDKPKTAHLLREFGINQAVSIPLVSWLKTQPGSTRRGVARGRFQLPAYVAFALVILCLSLVSSYSAQVKLAWSQSAESVVVGYSIYYGGSSGEYTNRVQIAGVSTTNWVISGLLNGVEYYFAATTCTAAGVQSPYSNELSTNIIAPAPLLTLQSHSVLYTNANRYLTNRATGIIRHLPAVYTLSVPTNIVITVDVTGAWTLHQSSDLVNWTEYITGTVPLAFNIPLPGAPNAFFKISQP